MPCHGPIGPPRCNAATRNWNRRHPTAHRPIQSCDAAPAGAVQEYRIVLSTETSRSDAVTAVTWAWASGASAMRTQTAETSQGNGRVTPARIRHPAQSARRSCSLLASVALWLGDSPVPQDHCGTRSASDSTLVLGRPKQELGAQARGGHAGGKRESRCATSLPSEIAPRTQPPPNSRQIRHSTRVL